MHVLCAPDSFKGCLAARPVADALAAGARSARLVAETCPVADGGEGTLDTLVTPLGGRYVTLEVSGPRGEPVRARFGLIENGSTAVVELAEASGLPLVPAEMRDPETASTCGTGRLIAAAVAAGVERIIVGLGGSATIDGGIGMAQAAGVTFFDDAGRVLAASLTGADLPRIARFARPSRLPRVIAAYDVDSPLCGPAGAAAVFGPQKGATPRQAARLDAALDALAARLGVDPDTPGFGAAGGAGFGLATFLGAELRPGAPLVLEAIGFDARCAAADLVLTGEGRLDTQSSRGKAVRVVAETATRHDVPCIAICGAIEGETPDWLTAAVDLEVEHGRQRALTDTARVLATTATGIVSTFRRFGVSAFS